MKKLLSVLFVFSLLMISVGPKQASALESIEIQNVNYPSVVAPGQSFCFSVTVKVNEGQLVESRGDMLRNTDGNLFGHWPHIAVAGTVNPSQTYTFNCYGAGITAPTSEGTYESKWRVWRNGGYVGPEAVIRFEVRNGGGDDGGGGGGNFSVQCPPGAASPAIKEGLFHRSAPLNETDIIEYAASVTVKYCNSEVDLAMDDDGFELESPVGSVSVDNEFNVTSANLTVGTTNFHEVVGVLKDNTDFPGLPYSGVAFTNTVHPPSTYFTVESEHEIRNIRRYDRPNYDYAFLPSVRTYVVETLANARFTMSTPAYLKYVPVLNMFFAAVIAGVLLAISYPSTSHSIAEDHPEADLPPASPEATALFEQRYGYMINWGNVSGLMSERDVVSAYTEFSVQGSGFSPNGRVYYQFGLPGQEPLIMDVVVADGNGNVNFDIRMPHPSLVPLGTYLLAAFDHYTINKTMEEALSENLDPSKFLVGVAAIEVVEDVTPPIITITSPTATNYSRCDQPVITFEVTDDLSGVAQVKALLEQVDVQNGTKLDMLLWDLGTHAVDIQAFDKVGWEQNEHLAFQLQASITGMRCAMDRFQTMKWFKTNGTFVSIDALLSSADRALASSRPDIAKKHFLAISKVLDAQKKMIDERAYKILFMDVNGLIQEPVR